MCLHLLHLIDYASVFYRYNDIKVVLNLVFLAVREYGNIKIRMFN